MRIDKILGHANFRLLKVAFAFPLAAAAAAAAISRDAASSNARYCINAIAVRREKSSWGAPSALHVQVGVGLQGPVLFVLFIVDHGAFLAAAYCS